MEEFPSGQRGQTVNLLLRLRWFESTLFHHREIPRQTVLVYRGRFCFALVFCVRQDIFYTQRKFALYIYKKYFYAGVINIKICIIIYLYYE